MSEKHTRAELFAARPFEDAFTGGVFLATGDLTGDGTPDVVVTPDEGGGPRVLVLDGKTFALVANFYGMAVAFTLVDALKHAGKDPTRQSVMDAAAHLSGATSPFLLPGISIHTGPGDRYPLDQVQTYRYHAGVWHAFGPLLSARP